MDYLCSIHFPWLCTSLFKLNSFGLAMKEILHSNILLTSKSGILKIAFKLNY